MKHPFHEPGGIYVHVPFCVRKCAYCDFCSEDDRSRIPAYLNALVKEIGGAKPPSGLAFDTLYLGGGTPSVLAPEEIGRILAAVRRRLPLLPGAEITIEANPGTLAPGALGELRRLGVNRINIGIQSFSDARLRFLGRIHSAKAGRGAVRRARAAGFDNIGLDLIYGLPGETASDWRAEMRSAAALGPEHLSCYMLTYEPGTPLARRLARGDFAPLDEARVGRRYRDTVRFLADRGFVQYEVSNFARSEAVQSRHNRKYWNFAPYLGFGPSAHSFIPPERWWNEAPLGRYLKHSASERSTAAERETVGYGQQIIEAVYLGLRQTRGIIVADFEARFGLDFKGTFGRVLAELRRKGWLDTSDAARCALTPAGMLFLDGIASMFVAVDFPDAPPA
jgi:oxygen-independent coproporphyrinogen-3 oxidase